MRPWESVAPPVDAATLRVGVGHDADGPDGMIYGLMPVLLIIYMRKGIHDKVLSSRPTGPAGPPAASARPPKRRE